MIMFAAGILVYEAASVFAVRRSISHEVEFAAAILFAGTVLAIPAIGTVPQAMPAIMLFIAFGALYICCISRPDGMLAKVFSITWLRWLGNMSYSYYLIHGIIVHGVRYLICRTTTPSVSVVWSVLPICFAFTWAGATVLFACVEKPFSFPGSRREGNALKQAPAISERCAP